MKDIIVYSIWLLGSFGLIILAAIMAFKSTDGWGWFFAVGLLCLSAFSYKDNQKDNSNKGGS